MGEKVDL